MPAETAPRYMDGTYLAEAKKRGVEFERRPRQRVVVLSSEMATPFGDEAETMAALYEGRSAIQFLPEGHNFYSNVGGLLPDRYKAFDELDHDDPRYKEGGELREFYLHKQKLHNEGHFRMSATMVDMAVNSAVKIGIWDEANRMLKAGLVHPYRFSAAVASGYAEGQRLLKINEHLLKDGDSPEAIRKRSRRMPVRDVMANFYEEFNAQTEIGLGAEGWGVSSPEACATSGSSLVEAARLIRDGYTDLAFGGGMEDALREYMYVTLGMFGGFQALAKGFDGEPQRASRPWSLSRNGFVASSGGGGMWLASLDWVIEHGLEDKIQAEIVSFAKGSDASDENPLMDPDRVADVIAYGVYDEMTGQMYDIDAVAAHVTGTQQGDIREAQAYRKVLNMATTRFTGPKSMLGHLLGGAGVANAIIAKHMFTDNLIPHTINLEDRDPEFNDMNIVMERPESSHDVDIALATALGFGGKNAVLAIRRWKKEYVQAHIERNPHLREYLVGKSAA